MPCPSSRKQPTVKKNSSETYKVCETLDNVVLPAAFLCVNVVALIVRFDLAIMMMVPNIFMLYQVGLLDHWKGVGLALLAIISMAIMSIDSFYILATHCLFYLTILMDVAVNTSMFLPLLMSWCRDRYQQHTRNPCNRDEKMMETNDNCIKAVPCSPNRHLYNVIHGRIEISVAS